MVFRTAFPIEYADDLQNGFDSSGSEFRTEDDIVFGFPEYGKFNFGGDAVERTALDVERTAFGFAVEVPDLEFQFSGFVGHFGDALKSADLEIRRVEDGFDDDGAVDSTVVGRQNFPGRNRRNIGLQVLQPFHIGDVTGRSKRKFAVFRSDGFRLSHHVGHAISAVGSGQREGGLPFAVVHNFGGDIGGVEVGNRPEGDGLGAVGLFKEEDAQFRVNFDFTEQFRAIEQTGHRRKCDEPGLHRGVAPHDAPILDAAAFAVGRKDEEIIACDTFHHQQYLGLGIEFGNDHLLGGRMGTVFAKETGFLAHFFQIGATLSYPDGTVGDVLFAHEIAQFREVVRIIRKRRIGVEVHAVGVERLIVRIADVIVGIAILTADGAGEDRQIRVSGLEAEIGSLQRCDVIPARFGSESDVLFVPELPVAHFSLERLRKFPGEFISCKQVVRQFRRMGFRPLRRVMIHAGNPDAAVVKKIGVGHVYAPVVLIRGGVNVVPAHPFAHMSETGEADQVADQFEAVSAETFVVHGVSGEPALRGVGGEEGVEGMNAFGRIDDDGEGTGFLKRHAGSREGKKIVSLMEWRKDQRRGAVFRPFAFEDGFVFPVAHAVTQSRCG